jgi:hypothetical protein
MVQGALYSPAKHRQLKERGRGFPEQYCLRDTRVAFANLGYPAFGLLEVSAGPSAWLRLIPPFGRVWGER